MWGSKKMDSMDLHQKIEFSKPSKLLHEQLILEILYEIEKVLPVSVGPLCHLFTLEGIRVRSLMEIH